MANVDAIVQEGIAALKAGRRDEARRILVKATELDERNEQAWLWLSGCVDSLDEQRICLENVLAINPANQKARRGLDALSKSSTAASSPVSPFAEGGFDSNPYAGTGFDSNPYGSSSNDPAIGTGWSGFDAGRADSPGTPGSVEWGNPDRPPAYGSGKDVPQPSSDEYDQWVNNLQLGGNPADTGATSGADADFDPLNGPFGSPSAAFDDNSSPFDLGGGEPFNTGTFGGGSLRDEPGAFDAPASRTPANPFGGFDDAGPFDSSFSSGDDAFGASAPARDQGGFANDDIDLFAPASQPPSRTDPNNARSSTSAPRNGGALRVPDDSDLFGGIAPIAKPPAGRTSGSSNPFGASANVFGDFPTFAEETAAEETFGGPGTSFRFDDKPRGISPYFDSIPSDIQVEGGAKLNMRLVLTVVGLGLLNAVSLGVLVLNLLNR